MQILQITDTHLYGTASGKLRGVETDPSLRATLDEAFARVPNYAAVLVTGDLVQDDKSGYLRFRSFFGGLAKPVLCIPGNHDEPDGKRGDVRLLATPSTGAQFLPKSDRYAVDAAPPAYRSFELHADGRIDSQVHWVESAQLRQAAS